MRLVICWGWLFIGLLICFESVWAANTVQRKESELRQVQTRIERVRRAIQADAIRQDALLGAVKNADEKIQAAWVQLKTVRVQRRALQQQLQQLELERLQTEHALRTAHKALATTVRLAYMNGHSEQLKLWLSQNDPAEAGRLAVYYGYFGRARAKEIAAINAQQARLAQLTADVTVTITQISTVEAQQTQAAQALAAERAQRADALTAVRNNLKTRTARLSRLQQEATTLERLITELRRTTRDFPITVPQAFARLQGKLPWPVKGKLLARFGQLRAGGPLKWQGVMIAAKAGTMVQAPLAGRVIYADWLPGLGLLLVLDHGAGFMTLYGHNEQLYHKVGDSVRAGEEVGVVGDTGIEGQNGVYFEVRQGKQPLNPLQWLTK